MRREARREETRRDSSERKTRGSRRATYRANGEVVLRDARLARVGNKNFDICSQQVVSTDSGLEAFSHNLTEGSVAPLACQPNAEAMVLNQQFLSY